MKIARSHLLKIIKEEIENVRLADVAHEYKKDHRGDKDRWNNSATLRKWVKAKGYNVNVGDLEDTLGIKGDKDE